MRFVSKSCDSQPFRPLRAHSSLRFGRSSPRNETTRPVQLRYETRVPFQVPCSLPFVPGPHAPTLGICPKRERNGPNRTVTAVRARIVHNVRGFTFAATRGQASSTCRSNEHQTNVSGTPTKRQHDINGTSTRHQRYVNRTSTKRQQNSNGSSTRQSTAVENSTYRDSMRHAVPFKMDASAGCSAGPSQCVTISPL